MPRAGLALVLVLLLAVLLAARGKPALAQDSYPSRPVKIIAPQAPGGGVDLVARIVADRLRVAMGQPFVDREPGGRRRRDRRADDRAREAGRLHADDRLRRHARDQSGREKQSRLRRGQGFHADRDARRHTQPAGGGARGAGQHAAGIRRLCEGQPRQGQLRHLGRGHAEPPGDGAIQARRRACPAWPCPIAASARRSPTPWADRSR